MLVLIKMFAKQCQHILNVYHFHLVYDHNTSISVFVCVAFFYVGANAYPCSVHDTS